MAVLSRALVLAAAGLAAAQTIVKDGELTGTGTNGCSQARMGRC